MSDKIDWADWPNRSIVQCTDCDCDLGGGSDCRNCSIAARHTGAFKRIPLASVPAAARAFADEVLGDGPAEIYFDTYYSRRLDLRDAA